MDNEIDLIEEGKNLSNQGCYQEAERAFREVLRLNQNNVQAHFELGKMYYIQKIFLQAIEELERAAALDNKHIDAYFMLGKAYKEASKYEEAIDRLTVALKLGYEGMDVHWELYTAYRDCNMFFPAARELKEAFKKGYQKESYMSDMDNIYKSQMRLIQTYNCDGNFTQVLKEASEASKIIEQDNTMYQNMLQNEIDIAQNRLSLSSNIRALTVTLTNKCNLACIMCKTRIKPWDLPEKHIKEIIALFPYLERVMWQGGEVFLYPGFKDLLKEASRFPMRKIIATNGLLIDREFAEIMVKSNVELTFSIDGATKDVYEHIRAGAKFEKVVENVNLINDLRQKLNPRMETRLNVLVMRSNCHQIEEFLDFAKKLKFNTVFFNSVGADFKNLNENIFCYSRDEETIDYINKIKTKLANKAKEYNIRLENWLPSSEFLDQAQIKPRASETDKLESSQMGKNDKLFCHVPWQRLYIDCEGLTRPDCLCPTEKYIGNILENTLKELWNGEKIKEYRRRIINNDYQNFCNPDCVFGRVLKKNLKFV